MPEHAERPTSVGRGHGHGAIRLVAVAQLVCDRLDCDYHERLIDGKWKPVKEKKR